MSAALRSSASLADCADISDRLPNDATRPLLVSGGSGKGGEGSAKGHRTWGRREEGTFYPAAAFSLKRRCFLARWVVANDRSGQRRTKRRRVTHRCSRVMLMTVSLDSRQRRSAGAGVLEEWRAVIPLPRVQRRHSTLTVAALAGAMSGPQRKQENVRRNDSRMTVRNAPIGILT